MDPLTYAACEADCDDKLQLRPCSLRDITAAMWEELAAQFAGERLIPYPADVLARRCSEGYAAAAICDGHIVSYTSFAPVIQHGSGPRSWSWVTEAIGIDAALLPQTDVFQFTSSWTHPDWRCRRISLALRQPLLDRYLCGDALGISGTVGLTSPIMFRLGWRILAWDAAPFVTSLIGVPFSDFPAQSAFGWRPAGARKPYQGPHISLDNPTHPWDEFDYCWVSDTDRAVALDGYLSSMMRRDLQCWRASVVATFARHESTPRLAFI